MGAREEREPFAIFKTLTPKSRPRDTKTDIKYIKDDSIEPAAGKLRKKISTVFGDDK